MCVFFVEFGFLWFSPAGGKKTPTLFFNLEETDCRFFCSGKIPALFSTGSGGGGELMMPCVTLNLRNV